MEFLEGQVLSSLVHCCVQSELHKKPKQSAALLKVCQAESKFVPTTFVFIVIVITFVCSCS